MTTPEGAAPDASELSPIPRLLAVLVAGALFADATARSIQPPGLSAFGRPPELSAVWASLGVMSVLVLGGVRDRTILARRMGLLLIAGCVFGGRALPVAPELLLALLGTVLLLAAPLIRTGPSSLAGAAALALSVPAVLAAPYTQGAVDWATALLPAASLLVLIPTLFPGPTARRAALALVLVTSALSFASLLTYLALSSGLDVPLGALTSTRLRPLGMHPNLAVPQLVTSLLIGCALAWNRQEPRRLWALLACLPIAGALLAVQSKTGLLAIAFGVGLLVTRRLPWRPLRLVHPLACLAVVAVLVFPVTGLGAGSITQRSTSMTSKAVSFRSAMWELGRDTLVAAPWHGFGPRSTHRQAEFARPSRYDGLPKDDHPHNVVLAVGSALGWPGLLGLAALLAASLRRRAKPSLLADSASAALLASWAANGIDMGGAAITLFPYLAFVALGIQDATTVDDESAADGDAPQRPRRPATTRVVAGVATVLGLATLTAGAAGYGGRHLLESAGARLDAEASGETTAEEALNPGAALEAELAMANRLRPFDPAVAVMRAKAAGGIGHRDEQLEHLDEARRRHPESVALMHDEAILRARFDPRDPEVTRLLSEAVRLDRYGPMAWQRLLDQALVRGGLGDEPGALDALVSALLLNPSAVEQVPFDTNKQTLQVAPQGLPGVTIPLARVFLELGRRRAGLEEQDPASFLRMRMREVEILLTLDLQERAASTIEHLLSDTVDYQHTRRGSAAFDRGEWELAVAELSHLDPRLYFLAKGDELYARSMVAQLDPGDFEQQYRLLLEHLPDVTFERQAMVMILRARRTVAERSHDADEALRLADRLEFARN